MNGRGHSGSGDGSRRPLADALLIGGAVGLVRFATMMVGSGRVDAGLVGVASSAGITAAIAFVVAYAVFSWRHKRS